MRWVYAAILTAHDAEARTYLDMRDRVRAESKRARLGVHAGGSRAALVLCVAGEPTAEAVRRFFAMKRALQPPWWRRNGAITDTFAAAHAAASADPRTVVAAREAAEAVFAEHPKAKGHRREGARLCALAEADPRETLARFERVETARREERYLKGRSDRSLAMEWAAQGMDAADVAELAAIMRALPKPAPSIGHGRARLAHLVLTAGAGGSPAGAAGALSAVLAAQAAVVAASAAAASTAATTAAGS
ncbi:hypothetical protein DDZ18_04620 [Marinicauda salina]|uniref:Uncharacterized protein n=2 Tax=Marinicauda salina TaxID=2135793 RepID=A0A2U2BXY3_9PROT|nr:hypothetical protein DDZ18_04620 [Marinicauda salina]